MLFQPLFCRSQKSALYLNGFMGRGVGLARVSMSQDLTSGVVQGGLTRGFRCPLEDSDLDWVQLSETNGVKNKPLVQIPSGASSGQHRAYLGPLKLFPSLLGSFANMLDRQNSSKRSVVLVLLLLSTWKRTVIIQCNLTGTVVGHKGCNKRVGQNAEILYFFSLSSPLQTQRGAATMAMKWSQPVKQATDGMSVDGASSFLVCIFKRVKDQEGASVRTVPPPAPCRGPGSGRRFNTHIYLHQRFDCAKASTQTGVEFLR